MPQGAPLPGKFDEDPRVHFDKTAGKWQYEDDESGQEYEWSDVAQNWIPIIDEADWKAQQAAYSVAGVDEEVRSGSRSNCVKQPSRHRGHCGHGGLRAGK